MSFKFTDKDIEQITEILNVPNKQFSVGWSWSIVNLSNNQSMILSIYNECHLGDEEPGTLISVQTQYGYYELHGCNGLMIFEPDEVIFIKADAEKVSSLIVGKEATCSLYSNISRALINTDISKLDAPVLLAAMQLSITENILP